MKVIKILCDQCGAEIVGNPFVFWMNEVDRDSGDVIDSEPIEKDFCKPCALIIAQDIADAMVFDEPEEPETPEPEPEEVPEEVSEPEPDEEPKETLETLETEPEPEPEPKETKVTETTHKPPRKRWITKEDAEEITKRYRAGEDMLKIADDLNLMRPQVSRFIAAGKLGQERYKNKTVPSNGGAPIPTCELGRSVGGEMSDWR